MGGDLQWLPTAGHPHVLTLRYDGITCVVNFGDRPVPTREDWGTPVLSSIPLEDDLLPANAAVWLAPAIPART
jgi:alpha-glucosidase